MSNTNHTNDGGPAFPILRSDRAGMSLRDWFAGQALAGKCGYPAGEAISTDVLADEAYLIADAMIAARNNQPSQP